MNSNPNIPKLPLSPRQYSVLCIPHDSERHDDQHLSKLSPRLMKRLTRRISATARLQGVANTFPKSVVATPALHKHCV